MSKGILKFDLPEELAAFRLAQDAGKYRKIFLDLKEIVEKCLERDHKFRSPNEVLKWIQIFLIEKTPK